MKRIATATVYVMSFVYHFQNKKEIHPVFNSKFAQENLRREQQRAGLLSVIFGAGALISLLMHVSYKLVPTDLLRQYHEIARSLIIFLGFMTLYELNVWNLMRFSLEKALRIPKPARFLNATFEITALSITLFSISAYFRYPITVMLSPFPLFFFFFIILSTLRLNFWLSVYTGIIAGVEYLLLSLYLLNQSGPVHSVVDPFLNQPLIYASQAVILMLCGLCAGYVAEQIQKSVESSIEGTETQNQLITLFGQQVSPQVAEFMIQQKGMLESRHMKVSVLFLDIRDFTKFAEKHTADEVVAYQNAFFRIIVEVVNRYAGVVNQFLGDGCMVSFGAPIIQENPAQNAVKAGLEIITEIRKAVVEKRIVPTSVGIGVHVGDAVIGNIGTETRQQFSITGNVVILAARIEQLNKEFGSSMLISQAVMNELTEKPATSEPLGVVHIKGMDDGAFLYKLR